MDCSKTPAKMRLVNATARHDKDTNAMVIDGTLQLSKIHFDQQTMGLKLSVEGTQYESVQRVFATGFEKSFHAYLYGRNSISKSRKNIFVKQAYEAEITRYETNQEEGTHEMCCSVSLGKESLRWWRPPTMKQKVQFHQGPYPHVGELEVSFMVKAFTAPSNGSDPTTSEHCQSNVTGIKYAPKTQQDDILRVEVLAPSIMIPHTRLCGLLEGPSTQSLMLIPSQSKIRLVPDQQLTIQLDDKNEIGSLLDLDHVRVKFTQRTVSNGESYDRHWERKLVPKKNGHNILQGSVEVPGWWTSSYNGSILQVVNEMIIYITQDGRKESKYSIIATTPKIIVQVTR